MSDRSPEVLEACHRTPYLRLGIHRYGQGAANETADIHIAGPTGQAYSPLDRIGININIMLRAIRAGLSIRRVRVGRDFPTHIVFSARGRDHQRRASLPVLEDDGRGWQSLAEDVSR